MAARSPAGPGTPRDLGLTPLPLRSAAGWTIAAIAAWYVACNRFTDRTFDALRAFREQRVDKAPEQVP